MARNQKRKSEYCRVTDEQFLQEEVLSSDIRLVGFWAPWCDPAIPFPHAAELIDDYFGKVKVARAQSGRNPDLTENTVSAPSQHCFFLITQDVAAHERGIPKRRRRVAGPHSTPLRLLTSNPKGGDDI